MYDYSVVLGLLRASAAELRHRALANDQARVTRMTSERTLRNRALLDAATLSVVVGSKPMPLASLCRRGDAALAAGCPW